MSSSARHSIDDKALDDKSHVQSRSPHGAIDLQRQLSPSIAFNLHQDVLFSHIRSQSAGSRPDLSKAGISRRRKTALSVPRRGFERSIIYEPSPGVHTRRGECKTRLEHLSCVTGWFPRQLFLKGTVALFAPSRRWIVYKPLYVARRADPICLIQKYSLLRSLAVAI
jgi:hypothetical protein